MLSDLAPPADPREAWGLPPLGNLAVTAQLDDVVTRIVAPNASPMTLDGTNTYLVGVPGSGTSLVIDPGPPDPAHLGRIEAALADADAEVALVLVTHHHLDHAESASSWAARWGCPVAAASPDVAGPGGQVLVGPGQVLRFGALRVEVVPTPGHCADHLAFRLGHGPLLTGDHVLGRGTSVVTWPGGDLVSYLTSLRRLLDLGPDALYPGHGPEMAGKDPLAVVRYYLGHRAFREAQILAVLKGGSAGLEEIVTRLYAELEHGLRHAATQSARAGLDKLAREGQITELPDGSWELVPRWQGSPAR